VEWYLENAGELLGIISDYFDAPDADLQGKTLKWALR
jgi:hypothetical protein